MARSSASKPGGVLPGDGAPFDRDAAAVGIGGGLLPAADDARVDAAGAEDRVARAGAQIGGQPVESGQEGAGLDDGVDAEVRAGAVGGDAGERDVGPDEPLVAGDEVQPGGFGDDRGVDGEAGGPQVGQDLLGADRGVLLVGDEGEHDVAAVRVAVDTGGGDHQGGDAGLHVVAASAVQPAAVDGRVERVAVVADEADGVEVPVEHDRPPAAPPGPGRQDRRASRRALRAVWW